MGDTGLASAVGPICDAETKPVNTNRLIKCLPLLLILAILFWKAQQMQLMAQPAQLLAKLFNAQHGASPPTSAVKPSWCSCPEIVQAPLLRQDPAALQLYQQMAEEVRAADQAQVALQWS